MTALTGILCFIAGLGTALFVMVLVAAWLAGDTRLPGEPR